MSTPDVAVAGIMHDMRNMMAAITTNCSILAESLPNEKSSIATNVTEALMHLNSLLTCLRGQAKEAAHRECASVQTVASQTTGLLASSYEDVEFLCEDLSADFDLRIPQCDLFRIFVNLITNAAEAALANVDRTPKVTVAFDAGEGAISVTDSGKGFREISHESAFVPYKTTRVTLGGQRGLGLCIVRTIAKSYGGSVQILRTQANTVVAVKFPAQLAYEPTSV